MAMILSLQHQVMKFQAYTMHQLSAVPLKEVLRSGKNFQAFLQAFW